MKSTFFLLLSLSPVILAQFNLTLLDPEVYPMARCLDGSSPGFYFAPGSGSGADKWIIHTQGGGWCVSDSDCAGRAGTNLGSSSFWSKQGCSAPNSSSAPPCYADGGVNGMLGFSPTLNPDLYNYNKVFIGYCDGGSYAGGRIEPVVVGSKTIYYRGRYNLDGIYDELFTIGLQTASTVIIKGCSAGGLAVYLHLDYLAGRIAAVNPGARVVGAPGAGFFLGEAVPYSGNGYLPYYKWNFYAHNSSYSVNEGCIAAHAATNDTWKCFIATETLPFVQTPLWISNSLTDAWQIGNIMGMNCNPGIENNCNPAEISYLASFREQMLTALAPIFQPGSKHGGFLQGCFVHVVEDTSGWTTVQVPAGKGQTQQQTFSIWLNQSTVGNSALVDTFPPYSNPTC